MQVLRQAGSSILLALASLALVIGGILLSLGENYMPAAPAPTSTLEVVTTTPTPVANQPEPTDTSAPTSTHAFIPPTSCPPPTGWIVAPVQPGQTLQTLSVQYRISVAQLMQANCLVSENLPPNALLALPPIPTNTVPPCGPPPGYMLYTVQPGEYPYKLSQAFGISLTQFLRANCMSTRDTLHIGQQVYVPNVATRTPSKTPTITLTSVIIIFPTNTRTPTQTATPSSTTIPSSTWTPTPTLTPTMTPTGTFTPPAQPKTATPTITAFSTQTFTPAP
ncbi:MAG: hypothetical protein Kow002_07470 [Anaerolineales bacterium]